CAGHGSVAICLAIASLVLAALARTSAAASGASFATAQLSAASSAALSFAIEAASPTLHAVPTACVATASFHFAMQLSSTCAKAAGAAQASAAATRRARYLGISRSML